MKKSAFQPSFPSFQITTPGSTTGTTTTTATANKSSFGWPSTTNTSMTTSTLFPSATGSGLGGSISAPSTNFLNKNIFQFQGPGTTNLPSTAITTTATTFSTLKTSTGQFNINNITKKTQFSDLPESVKSELIKIDKHIQNQKKLMTSINSVTLPNIKLQLQDVDNEIYILSQRVSQIDDGIQSDQTIMKDLLNDIYVQSSYVETTRQFYNAASRGQNDVVKQSGDAVFLKFYYDLILSFESKLQQYEINIEELDQQFKSLNDKYQYESSEQKLAAFSESLHSQYATLMSLAGKVAFLHENVEKLKQNFLNFMATNFLDGTNPFIQQNSGGGFR